MRVSSVLAPVVCLLLASAAHAQGVPNAGLAMNAEPKYKPDAKHFDYANPDAPKGGTVTLGYEGSFDSLNPYAVKGDTPAEMGPLIFQELGDSSLDEPFAVYPGVAESFDVAADKLSLTVKLRKEAKFSDGKPVTSADVVFSFKLFQTDAVAPFYKFYWADIKEVTAVDPATVKMIFKQVNPELAMIATQLPVLPKHVYEKGDFGKDHGDTAIGSGPYVVKGFKKGSHIVFKRNPDFWGKDLLLYKGRYNFDEISVKYFKDVTSGVEAFKKGDYDMYPVNSAKVWATDLTGDRFEKLKWIKKELWEHENNQGTQGFIFNMRLPMFSDVRVRKAIALAFDFDWSNKNLFYGQYIANESFFENSPLKATGLPTPEELAILEPLKADLPAEVFTKEMGWLGKGKDIKDRLREAVALLKEAGYTINAGVATGPAGRLEIKFLTSGSGIQRVVEPYAQNLKKLGILLTIEQRESSLYVKQVEARDFQLFMQVIGQSQSPGNEQRDFWTSAAADQNYSRNNSGLKNKGVDVLVDKVIYAKSRAELELYTRCLDRALYHQHLLVPNWHMAGHRVAYWDKFARPATAPKFYSFRQQLEWMWSDKAKVEALEKARASGAAL